MKTLYITITLVFVFSVATVATLYFMQPKPVKNGFTRGQIHTAKKRNELELDFGGWYITWLGDTQLYLSNYKAVLALFSCDYNLQDTLYGKLRFADGSRLRLDALKAQIVKKLNPGEDIFNTDGFVSLNEASGGMVYTYYYRNDFVYLDTHMKVLQTGKLIDTNSIAKIEPGKYKEGDKTIGTLTKPGLLVNKRGYIDGDWFYNHTALAADNESLDSFAKHDVFDVYALNNGRYSYSIYVPEYRGQQLTDFAVRGNLLIALYDRYLVTYKLPAPKGE